MKEKASYEVQPKSPVKIITYHFNDHRKIRRHWHEYLEILYIVRGKFLLMAEERVFAAGEGDIIVFNPFEVHESIEISDSNEYYAFVIPPEFIQSWQKNSERKFQSLISGEPGCTAALKKAAELSASVKGDEFLFNSEIFRFLHYAAEACSCPAKKNSEETEKERFMVEDIKNRISYCYPEPLNVKILSEAFFVSPSHLQHTFKAQTGLSLVDYINRTRIESSKRLLSETELRVSVVAEKVGIFDNNYFSRVFKKYVGISPKEYRKKIRELAEEE